VRRKVRRRAELVITTVGIGIIFGSILFVPASELQLHLLLTVVGVLCLEAGIWGLSSKLLPSERRYLGLRDEGDKIFALVRELHLAAIDRDRGAATDEHFQKTLVRMHSSIERMGDLAALDNHAGIVVASSTDTPSDPT
jgi:hypothetical protein